MLAILAALALAQADRAQKSVDVLISAAPTDPATEPLKGEVADSRKAIERFFERPFNGSIAVTLVSSRKAFDDAIPADWGLTPTQCWMVGAGIYDRLLLMSPTVWANQACDHRAGDVEEAKTILRHELIHVFHGQYNPTHDFAGMDDEAWFVEGLAVLVSGQLNKARLQEARSAVREGRAPARLSEAWSGKAKYGVSGSMVAYVDAKYGRQTIVDLLGATSTKQILARLHLTEHQFLSGGKGWLTWNAAALN